MVGYLLELLREATLAGPTKLMLRTSVLGCQQIPPSILGQSLMESQLGDAPKDEELDAPTKG
jgi:hypothetical protein